MARTISGIVEADGDKRSGEGFHSDQVGEGTYMVDFDQTFADYPVVVCSAVANIGETAGAVNPVLAHVDGVERHRVKIRTGVVDASTGGVEKIGNSAFSFIAIGD